MAWFLPPLILAAAAFYLHAHWGSIPERFPIHWRIDGQADRWVARTPRGVYGSLAFGGAMAVWLFGFSLAVWYGSRRSEPLRRPVLGVFIALEWAVVVMMSGSAMAPLIRLPIVLFGAISVAVILGSVVYLIKANRNSPAPLDPTPGECWKGGLLYYNPDDPVLFVGRRDGAGFTMNMANPVELGRDRQPVADCIFGISDPLARRANICGNHWSGGCRWLTARAKIDTTVTRCVMYSDKDEQKRRRGDRK